MKKNRNRMKVLFCFLILLSLIIAASVTLFSMSQEKPYVEVPVRYSETITKKDSVAADQVEDSEVTVEITKQELPEEMPKVKKKGLPDGYVYSSYTGLPIEEAVSKKRPVAIMINNHPEANPQSGISEADIIYEVWVEGAITRYMAVFQDYESLEKIGPVRSTRRYFLDFAMDQNAVLIHFGHDPAIEDTFSAIGCDHIEGISGIEKVMTWRSDDRKAPHNVYTSGEKLKKALTKQGFDLETAPQKDPMFVFYHKKSKDPKYRTWEEAFTAERIEIPYRSSQDFNVVTEFEYNAKKKVYERHLFGADSKDAENGKRLSAKNVLIQIADIHSRGDEAGHMDMTTIGSGDGYYICEGKAIPVTWKKESRNDTTKWYTEDGERLVMTPGQTWISIVSVTQDFTIE